MALYAVCRRPGPSSPDSYTARKYSRRSIKRCAADLIRPTMRAPQHMRPGRGIRLWRRSLPTAGILGRRFDPVFGLACGGFVFGFPSIAFAAVSRFRLLGSRRALVAMVSRVPLFIFAFCVGSVFLARGGFVSVLVGRLVHRPFLKINYVLKARGNMSRKVRISKIPPTAFK